MKSDDRIESDCQSEGFEIEDFFFAYSSFSEREKEHFVAFFVPYYASKTHKLLKPLTFSAELVMKESLKDFIKHCAATSTDQIVKTQILEFLVENEMCELKEDIPNSQKEILFTEKLLLILADVSEETGEEFVPVSLIAERAFRAGDSRAKVGGSITSLEKGGFLKRREDDENVRYVKITKKGKERIGKLNM